MPQLSVHELNKTFSKGRGFGGQSDRPKGPALQFILLAALVILLAIGSLKIFMQGKQESPTVQVVAAGQDIPCGSRINFNSLHYLNIPKRYALSAMFSSYEELVGKTTSTYIKKGNPILKQDLLPASVSRAIKPSHRAITLRLEPEFLVDHSMLPGDRVDVIATINTPQKSKKLESKKFTKTICQNLLVLLSTPREMALSNSGRSQDANRITLIASPDDCEKLTQAAESAKLRLVLRNPANSESEHMNGADDRDLIPAYALKEMAQAEITGDSFAQNPSLPPPPPVFAQAPAAFPESIASQIPEAISQPVQWVVEMFSGSKKENYAIPAR